MNKPLLTFKQILYSYHIPKGKVLNTIACVYNNTFYLGIYDPTQIILVPIHSPVFYSDTAWDINPKDVKKLVRRNFDSVSFQVRVKKVLYRSPIGHQILYIAYFDSVSTRYRLILQSKNNDILNRITQALSVEKYHKGKLQFPEDLTDTLDTLFATPGTCVFSKNYIHIHNASSTVNMKLKHNLKQFSTSTFALYLLRRIHSKKNFKYAIQDDNAILHTQQFTVITKHSNAIPVFTVKPEITIPKAQIQVVHAYLQEMYSEDRLVQILPEKNQTRVVVLEGFNPIGSWYLSNETLPDSFLLPYSSALFAFGVLAKAKDEQILLGHDDKHAVFHTSVLDIYTQIEPFNVYSYN